MAKSRLVFTLLMTEGSYNLSRNFDLQFVGDLNWIRESYGFDAIAYSIDELIILNVEEDQNMKTFAEHLEMLSQHCFIPLAAGGGIRSLEDAYTLLNSGADKLVVNTPVIKQPDLVLSLVEAFGSQSIVASIDFNADLDVCETFIENGKTKTGLGPQDHVKRAEELGCGEIYLTSMERDGTGQGLDIETLQNVVEFTTLPVIASGGVGKFRHFVEGIQEGKACAVSTANLFNFMEDGLSEARKTMQESGIEMASWDIGFFDEFIRAGEHS